MFASVYCAGDRPRRTCMGKCMWIMCLGVFCPFAACMHGRVCVGIVCSPYAAYLEGSGEGGVGGGGMWACWGFWGVFLRSLIRYMGFMGILFYA